MTNLFIMNMNRSSSAPATMVSYGAEPPVSRTPSAHDQSALVCRSWCDQKRQQTVCCHTYNVSSDLMCGDNHYYVEPTNTQSCPLHTTYGAAPAFQPYAAYDHLNCSTISHSGSTPMMNTCQSHVIDGVSVKRLDDQ